MFEIEEIPELNKVIAERVRSDRRLLDDLCKDVRQLSGAVRSIKARSATSVSLVASDGGNNKLEFDPFYVQLVRVVDSYGKRLCLDCVSPSTDTDVLSKAQFNSDGTPRTALGQVIRDLGIDPPTLNNLSHMIPDGKKVRENPGTVSPSWVLVYRDLCEWAALYERVCHRTFATDTLIVRDGLLRSKLFRGELFIKLRNLLQKGIERVYREDRRHVFLVGLAKHTKVLARYSLAMSVEGTLPPGEARYVRIPRDMEAKAYVWPEYARGAEVEGEEGEAPKFVAGDMFVVRFGPRSGDPVWTVDVFSPQSNSASEVFGYLLSDAIDGFPIPFYPRCLQKAHEYAEVVDFDLDILQDGIISAIRDMMPDHRKHILDALHLQTDVAARRYE